VRAAPRPEPVAEPEEGLLVDRIQHFDHRALDDLVLQRCDAERALSAVRLWNVPPSGRLRPVCAPVNTAVQIHEPALEVLTVFAPRDAVDPGSRIPLERRVGGPEPFDIDVVEERGEPFLLPCPCNVPYAVQPLGHAFPVLRPVRVVLTRVPLGPRPSLHPLLSRHAGSVRGLRRYYGGV